VSHIVTGINKLPLGLFSTTAQRGWPALAERTKILDRVIVITRASSGSTTLPPSDFIRPQRTSPPPGDLCIRVALCDALVETLSMKDRRSSRSSRACSRFPESRARIQATPRRQSRYLYFVTPRLSPLLSAGDDFFKVTSNYARTRHSRGAALIRRPLICRGAIHNRRSCR